MSVLKMLGASTFSGPPKVIEYVTNVSSTADATSYTFTAASIGTEASDRYIILGVTGSSGATGPISTVTVAGNSATVLTQVSGATVVSGLYIISIPTGTTADIVVTFSVLKNRCAVGIWKATGILSATPYDTGAYGSENTENSGFTNVDILNGGFVVASASRGGTAGGTTTWTGATENYDFNTETRIITGASSQNMSAEVNRRIQTSFTTSGVGFAIAAASF